MFSEYHAVGTPHGYYMLRDLRYKYVHYVNAPPQLFDMQNDPWELQDLAQLPEYQTVLAERERRLRVTAGSRGSRRASARGPTHQDRSLWRGSGGEGARHLHKFTRSGRGARLPQMRQRVRAR